MTTSVKSFPVPSLIQGISQQSPQSRGQASAKDQKNCINDVLLGARARNGSKLKAFWSGSRSRPFFHEIKRSASEEYLVMITSSGLEVINLVDGTKATVTGDISSYLSHVGNSDEAFVAATVEDTTFIGNTQTVPAMASTTSAARTNWGIAHFKSSNYSTDYHLHIKVDGVEYSVNYKTANNSSADNADFIATNRLAQEFTSAITGTLIPALNAAGKTGFTAVQSGSSIRIFGGTHDFSMRTEDGLGGQQFIAFTDRVQDVSDLPTDAWNGYEVSVGTTKDAVNHDFYLKYTGGEQDGVWEEVVAPSTKTNLDATTMPHTLVNTGVNAFTVQEAPWGARLAGDGIDSAKEPSFIGREIKDLQFTDSRLAIITEASYSLSRARNGYVYFPDTVQTSLDTAPIDYEISNGKVTLLSKGVVVGESLQLWANGAQLSVGSGDNILSEETVESPPVTHYDYDGRIAPLPVGMATLLFGTARGRWNNLVEVYYRNNRPDGEINVVGHCPKLIKGDIKQLLSSSTLSMSFVTATNDLNTVFVYQWLNSGRERVQSAWNPWDFPAITEIIWVGYSGSSVRLLCAWPNGHSLEELDTEYEGDEDEAVPLRADHRVDESNVTATNSDHLVVTLPYEVPSAKRDAFVAYMRVDDDGTEEQRGVILQTEWITDTTLKVFTENASLRFWVGAKIESKRVPSQLYITTDRGTVLLDNIKIMSLRVSHTKTTEYRVDIVPKGNEERRSTTFSSRKIGDPSVINNRVHVSEAGETKVKVGYNADEVSIELINDSIYPSSWEALDYLYVPTKRTNN